MSQLLSTANTDNIVGAIRYDKNKPFFIKCNWYSYVLSITSLNKRDRHTIGKGEQYAFNALELVHQKYPDIVVEIFDAPERPNVPKCSIFCVLQ